MKHIWKTYNLVGAITGAIIIGSCASMGRPEGGARDVEPPVPLSSNPPAGQLNFNGKRLIVNFDENIQIDDAFNKVVVSPAMSQPPAVSANGRRLTVEFRDTLRDSTTYTVDFADAIKDLNEGNILDGFAIDFSTGPTIDTLRISGMVLGADNLEPAQGMLVGVHSNLSDSALTKLPLDRIARTNQLGQFTIRNLPAGRYHVFAIDDVNRDNRWDRSEAMAFYDVTVEPVVEQFELTDTLRSSQGGDSTAMRRGLRYLPNDVLLSLYKEDYTPQYLKDYGRPERRKANMVFGAKADSLPVVTITNGEFAGRDFSEFTVLQANPGLDSLTYWISDPRLIEADTLRLAVNPAMTLGEGRGGAHFAFDAPGKPCIRSRFGGMEVSTWQLKPDTAADDLRFLRMAVDESRKCVPCATSYCVGAVVVTSDGSVFTGRTHETSATHHAEQEAVAKALAAGARLRGASIYSSMEPCSKRASEPESCTELILRHGFAHVAFALYEPDCFVACRGALRESGVDVRHCPELAGEVRAANAHLWR